MVKYRLLNKFESAFLRSLGYRVFLTADEDVRVIAKDWDSAIVIADGLDLRVIGELVGESSVDCEGGDVNVH